MDFCNKWNMGYEGRGEPHWNLSVVYAQQRQAAILCGVEAATGIGLAGRRKSIV